MMPSSAGRAARAVRVPALAGLLVPVAAVPAAAHDGQPIVPHDLWGAWSFEPWVVLGLGASLAVYAMGLRRLWTRAGRGHGVRRWECASFLVGWAVLALSLVSPLHALGSALLSAHMVQHELLMLVAAPLLVLGRPMVAALWAAPQSWRRGAGAVALRDVVQSPWGWMTAPFAAAAIHAAAIWLWHAPGLYERAVRSEVLHALQHVAFIGTALLFWWALLHARRSRTRDGQAIAVLFMTALHTGALGALLAFAPSLWYSVYAATTGPWGLSPLEDQQMAGMIMWIPGGGAYIIAGLALTLRVLGGSPTGPRAVRGVATAAVLIAFAAGCRGGLDDERHPSVLGGDAERGKIAISEYGCPSCHVIPGIRGAEGTVGPPLAGIASRSYIAGVLSNTPENMVRWIVDPPKVDSLTAMPALGISDSLARDIAEYLYRIR